jgi:tetratricopeptide (TPR) repeat protein/predicted Ser/Thr protein kinase
LTPERYQQVKQVFQEACRCEPAERASYLDAACGADVELRGEVEALLAHDGKTFPVKPGISAAAALGLGRMDAHDREGSSGPVGFRSATAKLPERIGHYRIIRKIGQGGMGVVLEAEQDHPRRTIALKVIRPGVASEQLLRRFKYEAQVLGRLQHPGIAQVYEAGTAEIETDSGLAVEQPFFAMEYVRGKPLNELIGQRDLGTRRRLELFATICDAVQHAHQKGVIHRDLKPANILVDESGQPRILDFGVARVTDADVQMTTLQTDIGQLIGTLPYMSPEQVAGDSRELDTRSDVYALGVICFELLTGRLPYELEAKTIPEAARTIAQEDPTRLSSINRVFRGDLDTIVAKALEKDRDRRYQSASDLAADIRRYLSDQPIAARPATAWYQLRKFARRNRVLVASLAGIAATLIVATVVSAGLAIWARGAEELARERLVQAKDAQRFAEEKRSEATEALAKATAEATRANAFRDFLVRMLGQINPDTAQGRDVSLLRDVLAQAAQEIETELAAYPDVQAGIHHVIGTVYGSISEYERAEHHLQTAYELRAHTLGEDDVETLQSLAGLADVAWNQGRLEDAEAAYDELIRRYNRTLGETHRDTLLARFSHAGVLKTVGRVDEAEQELRDVLTAMQTHLGDHDDAVLDAMNGLAALALERGRTEEAEALWRTLLQRWSAVHGPRHPKRLRALMNLATVVKERGDLAEAEELSRECVELHGEVFGEDHHSTIQARINFASLLRERGKLEQAEPVARQALERAARVLGPEHPDTLIAISQLGVILRLRNELDEARPYLEDAVQLSDKLYGREDPRTLSRLSSLAGLLNFQGRYAEAEVIMREVVDGTRAAYGEENPQTLMMMNNLGLLLIQVGKLDEAEELLMTNVELADRAAPPGHWFREAVRVSYGECLLAQQRFERAESVLLGCYQRLSESMGAEHFRTRGAVDDLVKLYEAWGKPDQAAEWRAKLPATQPAPADEPPASDDE